MGEVGRNRRIIAEFRANNGAVGGEFAGAPLLLLTTAGRRTGRPRTVPLGHLRDGPRHVVFASAAGAPTHPDWYANLLASAQVTVELSGDEGRITTFAARATTVEGAERAALWERQCAAAPVFRTYQERTARTIPVVALVPLDLGGDAARRQAVGRQLLVHHDELRAELAAVRQGLQRVVEGAPQAAGEPLDALRAGDVVAQLHRRCLTYCHGLQMHHTREDGAFTAIEREFPELAPQIARLRAEHRVVEEALGAFEEVVQRALAVAAEPAEAGSAARLLAQLDRVTAGLADHFAYEEEHLLPALGVTREE